jgi:peptidoglycan/LPS O-acetylase OafA/YrhL
MVIAWGVWLVTLIAFPPALARDFDRLVTPVAAGFALLIGMIYAVAVGRRQRRAVAPTVRISLIALLLFLLPYVLWTQGAIPFYSSATLYALALTAATLIAGFFYMLRYGHTPAESTPEVIKPGVNEAGGAA